MNKYKNDVRDGFLEKSRSLGDLLPPPAVLESYEELKPGMVDELIDIVKKEQKHRHNHEKNALQAMAYTMRFGQLLAFALAVIIIYAAIAFASDDMYFIAIAVLVCGFGFLAGVHFIPKFISCPKQDTSKNKVNSGKPSNKFSQPKRQGNSNKRSSQSNSRAGGGHSTRPRRRIHSKK